MVRSRNSGGVGAGYGVIVCRKQRLDGVLIGCWDAQEHLRIEGQVLGSEVAVRL